MLDIRFRGRLVQYTPIENYTLQFRIFKRARCLTKGAGPQAECLRMHYAQYIFLLMRKTYSCS